MVKDFTNQNDHGNHDIQQEDEVTVLRNQLKRALADYQNLQKRFDKEKEDVVKFANEVLISRLLSVVEGLEMVMRQFQDVLTEQGFEKVDIKNGMLFDANFMEAIDGEGEIVDEVYSYGYKLHDKIVKHGRVKVRKE